MSYGASKIRPEPAAKRAVTHSLTPTASAAPPNETGHYGRLLPRTAKLDPAHNIRQRAIHPVLRARSSRLSETLGTAVTTTSATSWGWELMTTCDAASTLGHGGAHAVVAEAVDARADTPVGVPKHPPDATAAPRRGWRWFAESDTGEGSLGDGAEGCISVGTWAHTDSWKP